MIRDLANIAVGALLAFFFFLAWQNRDERPENVVVVRSPAPCTTSLVLGQPLLQRYKYGRGFECHYAARKP